MKITIADSIKYKIIISQCCECGTLYGLKTGQVMKNGCYSHGYCNSCASIILNRKIA